ncbi:methyltransferase, TIGR00027 family [Evansella caseinilytica]|uniref:S-adenosyl-L-methionine-dependent methyltransferase n=1 Tax=Evansella caseinilytica TaxID=1503961 RepID=A0A1H3UGK7_9BACI|nr:class I SAM-dependent methyltransferase [Evansella caseinilytica]SDZ61528.1 methyltransferase, TIGR00027 family [Evansella caseinilytica]
MKENESSLTSLISAFGRAYHSQFDTPKIFNDYVAKQLITQTEFHNIEENMVQNIHYFNERIAEKYKGQPQKILKWITQIQLSPTPLARAAFCEKMVLNEMALGTRQYVLLGAGFDTFCFRHPELASSLEIFEVDSPATQQLKKKRLVDAGFEIPNNLHFVPMDFSKGFLYLGLTSNGMDCRKKTCFSLLGVSYYLTKDENSTLLEKLFAAVPSGSSILFDYADENLFKEKGKDNRVENMVKMASASGEPMKACFSYHEIEKILEKAGLLIYQHLSPAEIDEQYFKDRDDYLSAFETIHFIHAVKK